MNKQEREKLREQTKKSIDNGGLRCDRTPAARMILFGTEVLALLDHIDALEGHIELKDSAINDVIGYNIQEAIDRYGDSSKADSWACVRRLREAIASAPEVKS